MSEWSAYPEPLWPKMQYRHVMCHKCGEDLPVEYK